MLTGPGGYAGSLGAISVPADRHGNVPVTGDFGVVHVREHSRGLDLLIPDDIGHVVNGGARHGVVPQQLPQVHGRVCAGRFGQELEKLVAVHDPCRIGCKPRVHRQLP